MPYSLSAYVIQERSPRNEVTESKIVCGNKTVTDRFTVINCKKDKSDQEKIPILMINVHNAFDFMHAKGLQLNPSETETVIYQQGKQDKYILLNVHCVLNVLPTYKS